MINIKKNISLAEHSPWLIKEWDFNKNVNISPYNIGYGSDKKVFWICPNNHSYQSSISNRAILNRGCPYCSGRKVCKENSLETLRPDLIKEWNYNKNSKTPKDFTVNSNKKVWWICEKGHEWEAKINHRTTSNSGCPYCSGRKVCKENSLAFLFPNIASEWHPTKNGNLTPKDVTSKSGKKVWWKCSKCEHEWKTAVHNRTHGGCNCPKCNINASKAEELISKILENNKIKYIRQYKIPECKNIYPLPFDFAVFKENNLFLLIEYDGQQHYKEWRLSDKKLAKRKLKKIQKNDQIKSNYCKQNNIPLLRIPYWEFDKIEEILEKEVINKINNNEIAKEVTI